MSGSIKLTDRFELFCCGTSQVQRCAKPAATCERWSWTPAERPASVRRTTAPRCAGRGVPRMFSSMNAVAALESPKTFDGEICRIYGPPFTLAIACDGRRRSVQTHSERCDCLWPVFVFKDCKTERKYYVYRVIVTRCHDLKCM